MQLEAIEEDDIDKVSKIKAMRFKESMKFSRRILVMPISAITKLLPKCCNNLEALVQSILFQIDQPLQDWCQQWNQ